jgi:hypothetical protein
MHPACSVVVDPSKPQVYESVLVVSKTQDLPGG